jgi:hypothetical protein
LTKICLCCKLVTQQDLKKDCFAAAVSICIHELWDKSANFSCGLSDHGAPAFKLGSAYQGSNEVEGKEDAIIQDEQASEIFGESNESEKAESAL